jgi:hypothetical protein
MPAGVVYIRNADDGSVATAKHRVRPSWGTGLSGLSALICMSLTTAFDMPCLRSPLWLGASASTQLRRRPLVQFGPEAALMCLRCVIPSTLSPCYDPLHLLFVNGPAKPLWPEEILFFVIARGGRPLTPRSGIAALTWGHAVRKCDARVSSRTNGLFLSLRCVAMVHS